MTDEIMATDRVSSEVRLFMCDCSLNMNTKYHKALKAGGSNQRCETYHILSVLALLSSGTPKNISLDLSKELLGDQKKRNIATLLGPAKPSQP